jgi:hypothetical protein
MLSPLCMSLWKRFPLWNISDHRKQVWPCMAHSGAPCKTSSQTPKLIYPSDRVGGWLDSDRPKSNFVWRVKPWKQFLPSQATGQHWIYLYSNLSRKLIDVPQLVVTPYFAFLAWGIASFAVSDRCYFFNKSHVFDPKHL